MEKPDTLPVPTEAPGGQGDVAPLADEHHTRSDINLVRRAVRQRWPVPDEVRPVIVARLVDIVNKRKVSVMTKDGPIDLDGPADSNAIAAARVLVAMEGANQADDHLADKNDRMDTGKPTDVVVFNIPAPKVIGEGSGE